MWELCKGIVKLIRNSYWECLLLTVDKNLLKYFGHNDITKNAWYTLFDIKHGSKGILVIPILLKVENLKDPKIPHNLNTDSDICLSLTN